MYPIVIFLYFVLSRTIRFGKKSFGKIATGQEVWVTAWLQAGQTIRYLTFANRKSVWTDKNVKRVFLD